MGGPHGPPIPGHLSGRGFFGAVRRGWIGAALLAAAVPAAWAQSVKDFVEVEGARPNKLRGYGLVTGLGGTGDSARDESARLMKAMLQNLVAPEASVQKVEGRNAALVLVTAELRPFQKQGTRLDVSVSALGDAKSLAGGELQLTDLRGPLGRRGPIYALASGRLTVQGDGKRGSLTSATIPNGAIVERELEHRFVAEVRVPVPGGEELRRKGFKLVLKRPDPVLASQLAGQINASAVVGTGGRLDVAASLDGGSVLVRIPTVEEYRRVTGSEPEVDYEREPVRWLDFILSRPVLLSVPETAAVVVNEAARTISWTGDVRLREGSVMVAAGGRPGVFHAREGQRFSEFMEKAGTLLTDQQLIDLVRALDQAGILKAELRTP